MRLRNFWKRKHVPEPVVPRVDDKAVAADTGPPEQVPSEEDAGVVAEPVAPVRTPVIRSCAIAMVKNEQDIIEPFLRHNARFVDRLMVIDNASVDRTEEITIACARELGSIGFCSFGRFEFKQSDWMTSAVHFMQGAFFADFIVFLDADEFISAPDRASFDAALERIPVGGYGLIPWQTYLPDPTVDPGPDPLGAMGHRRRVEDPPYFKAVLRLGGHVAPDLVVTQGNHKIIRRGAAANPPAVEIEDVVLQHFPLRSPDQLTAKAVVGWVANLARHPDARKQHLAHQWRRLFDGLAASGRPVDRATLALEALRYAQHERDVSWQDDAVPGTPVPFPERRYSDGSSLAPLSAIARSWERSVATAERPAFAARQPATEPGKPEFEGAFDDAWHWENTFVDIAPLRYLARRFEPASVFDVGCGSGHYLALFSGFGAAEIHGIDGISPEATVLEGSQYTRADLQQPFASGRRHDLVMCLEVAEHLPAEATETLLDTVESHAREMILFSAAEPGQPGHGHINCLPIPEILALWQARGWSPDLMETLTVRALSTLSWFRRNLIVLRPSAQVTDPAAAVERLGEIAARPYVWYHQEPGIRPEPFHEPYPKPAHAYGCDLAAPVAEVD